MKFSTNIVTNIPAHPLITVIGTEPYRSKLTTDLLSNDDLFSKKFGRIVYIGCKKYKSELIVVDEQNYIDQAKYEDIMNFLDIAKTQNIVNFLFVFNCKEIKVYQDIIQKLIGVRFTYLKGIISIMIVIPNHHYLNKELFKKFNICFYTDTEHLKEIAEVYDVKGSIVDKRKKDAYVIGENKIQVYKEITG